MPRTRSNSRDSRSKDKTVKFAKPKPRKTNSKKKTNRVTRHTRTRQQAPAVRSHLQGASKQATLARLLALPGEAGYLRMPDGGSEPTATARDRSVVSYSTSSVGYTYIFAGDTSYTAGPASSLGLCGFVVFSKQPSRPLMMLQPTTTLKVRNLLWPVGLTTTLSATQILDFDPLRGGQEFFQWQNTSTTSPATMNFNLDMPLNPAAFVTSNFDSLGGAFGSTGAPLTWSGGLADMTHLAVLGDRTYFWIDHKATLATRLTLNSGFDRFGAGVNGLTAGGTLLTLALVRAPEKVNDEESRVLSITLTGAFAANEAVATTAIPGGGYYRLVLDTLSFTGITNSGVGVCTVNPYALCFSASVYTNTSVWASWYTDSEMRTNPDVPLSLRVNAASMLISNISPVNNLGGMLTTARTESSHPTALGRAAASALDSMRAEIPSLNMATGCYTWMMPVTAEKEFLRWVNSFGCPIYYLDRDFPQHCVQFYGTDGVIPQQTFRVEVSALYEFQTAKQLYGRITTPTFMLRDLEEAMLVLRGLPYFTENPSHLQKIYDKIKSAGVGAYNMAMRYGPSVARGMAASGLATPQTAAAMTALVNAMSMLNT